MPKREEEDAMPPPEEAAVENDLPPPNADPSFVPIVVSPLRILATSPSWTLDPEVARRVVATDAPIMATTPNMTSSARRLMVVRYDEVVLPSQVGTDSTTRWGICCCCCAPLSF